MALLRPVDRFEELTPQISTCANDIKVILVGAVCAGKTSLFARFTNENFDEDEDYVATVSGGYAPKKVVSQEWNLTLHVWDTAGSERFKSMTTVYFRNAKVAIVCFDLTTLSSFDEIRSWIRDVRAVEPMCKIYVCGTKKDLIDSGTPRAVPLDTVLLFAGDEMFQRIADEYTADPANMRKLRDVIRLGPNAKSKSCCEIF